MREILFRGKQEDNNEWIYGGALHQTDCYGDKVDKWFIIDGTHTNDYDIGEPIRVIPETIGQYTGLTDKNGKKIFEGDIVHGYWNTKFLIFFDLCCLQFRAKLSDGTEKDIDYYGDSKNLEVIGNIHDNPELSDELV